MTFEQFTDVMYRPWRIDPGFSWHSGFCVPELEYFAKPRSGLKYFYVLDALHLPQRQLQRLAVSLSPTYLCFYWRYIYYHTVRVKIERG